MLFKVLDFRQSRNHEQHVNAEAGKFASQGFGQANEGKLARRMLGNEGNPLRPEIDATFRIAGSPADFVKEGKHKRAISAGTKKLISMIRRRTSSLEVLNSPKLQMPALLISTSKPPN